jgi:hypothetical protein
LYPQHRRPAQPAVLQGPREPVRRNRQPSPTPSDTSNSSADSYESWNGIAEEAPLHHDPPIQPDQPPVDPAPLPLHLPPPPSPSIPGSDLPPFGDQDEEPRKFFLLLHEHPSIIP